jgi:MFS family permease
MLSKAESILLWSSTMWGFGVGMFGPLYAIFATEVGGNILDVSWVYALYLIFMGLGVIAVGKMADKKGHEILLVTGYALSAIASFGYLFVNSVGALLFVQLLIGVSTALSQPTWYALYDKYSGDGDRDGYIWGLSTGLWYVFQGLALILGGYLVSLYSFDVLFVVMGIVLSVSTIYQARILRYRVQ